MRRLLALFLLIFLMAAGLTALAEGSAEAPGLNVDELAAIPENWLVIDADVTTKVRYHHPASFDAPQGYALSAFTDYDDGVTQSFYLVAEDPAAPVEILYVDAVAGITGAEYIQRSLEFLSMSLNASETAVPGEAFTAAIGGREALCLYIAYSTAAGDYGSLFCTFDAPYGICVYAVIGGAYTTPEVIQTPEELLLQAEALLAGLTIIE